MNPQSAVTIRLVAMLALAACGGGSGGYTTTPPPPPPPDRTVNATPNLAFTPPSLQVAVGEVVTFAFGSVAHNVFFATQAGAPQDIASATSNASVQRTFTTAGTYHYACHIHPGMQGDIVVR